MVISPTSPHHASPFADPSPEDKHNLRRASLASAGSGSSLSPLRSPVEGNGFSYGYVGPSWRGGGAAQQGHAQPEAGEKWWHALCSWGSDLDGDGENEPGGQAGRTNPFE